MVQIYKCPSCGANMVFDAKTQRLVCGQCGRQMPVWEFEASPEKEKAGEEDGSFKMFHCPSCGAQLLTDAHTTATFCNYCGSSTLIESRLTGEYAPDYIIPFKIANGEAKKAFVSWAKRGLLTPPGFVSKTTIEKISGIYVPFWLYDFDVDATVEADCTRTRIRRFKNQEMIDTDHFHVTREVRARFERVPCDASEKMDDRTMNKLEPYFYDGMTPFKMEYMSGFLAEKYNGTSDLFRETAQERVKEYGLQTAMESIQGYETVTPLRQDIRPSLIKTCYSMLPVWMLNYRYNGKDYMFTMNGQTGKVVGEAPVCRWKAAFYFVLFTGILFAMGILLLHLLV